MSHIHFCVDTACASDFGETDSTIKNEKLKLLQVFLIEQMLYFERCNSVTDQFSNSNNFAVEGNLTNTEDCPSNIFATFNYNANNANASLSQGTTASHVSTSVVNIM